MESTVHHPMDECNGLFLSRMLKKAPSHLPVWRVRTDPSRGLFSPARELGG